MSGAKLIPGVASGFVAAFGVWSVLTKDAPQKLPKTVTDPAWGEATKQLLMAMPRQGSDTPVTLNPGRFL